MRRRAASLSRPEPRLVLILSPRRAARAGLCLYLAEPSGRMSIKDT
jgi:hypothetical protein